MPNLDRTGPEGKGPMTGRGLGRCKQKPDDDMNTAFGRGMGMRRRTGGGQGKGSRFRGGREDE